jgi:hypothetical protein
MRPLRIEKIKDVHHEEPRLGDLGKERHGKGGLQSIQVYLSSWQLEEIVVPARSEKWLIRWVTSYVGCGLGV